MKTQLTVNKLALDFSASAESLLDQLDRALTPEIMSLAAVCSAGRFEFAADQPAEEQAALVAKLSTAVLRDVDAASPDSVAYAVGAAALLMAAKAGPSTASERIRTAAGMLSERYQADW